MTSLYKLGTFSYSLSFINNYKRQCGKYNNFRAESVEINNTFRHPINSTKMKSETEPIANLWRNVWCNNRGVMIVWYT